MQSYQDKQRFVNLLLNVDYFNKELTRNHVMEFLKKQQAFSPRESIRCVNDQYFSFLELSGFMQIGNSLIEMFIGIPKNYPSSPPAFLLHLDRETYVITNEQMLLKDKMIAFDKNQSGDQYMRILLPIVTQSWVPKNSPTLARAFTALCNTINRPPILTLKNDPMKEKTINYRKSMIGNSPQKKANINNEQIKSMIGSLHEDMTEMIFSKKSLEDANMTLDFNICRQTFMREHLEGLKHQLRKKQSFIRSNTNKMENTKLKIDQTQNCDQILQISPKQQAKLNILSEQQALKEAEITLRAKIQKDSSIKFGDYKKVMKVLFDRMFDNQSQLLQQKVINDH